MKQAFSVAAVIALACSGAALADDDCRSPMADWQPRDAAISRMQQLGISAERLKIDDGCYEIKGRDTDGSQVEVILDPGTLAVIKLEIRFHPQADPSRYLPDMRGQTGLAPRSSVGNPLLTPGTMPQADTN